VGKTAAGGNGGTSAPTAVRPGPAPGSSLPGLARDSAPASTANVATDTGVPAAVSAVATDPGVNAAVA
jgi:hypothetical protein